MISNCIKLFSAHIYVYIPYGAGEQQRKREDVKDLAKLRDDVFDAFAALCGVVSLAALLAARHQLRKVEEIRQTGKNPQILDRPPNTPPFLTNDNFSIIDTRIYLQLRLWGDHGQRSLEAASVCLVRATATG